MIHSNEYYTRLVNELCKLPSETEWVEFKSNDEDPKMIGKNISALANSAALIGKEHAYLVWGIKDVTHQIIGTSFKPKLTKQGNEELESWLAKMIEPKINFHFIEMTVDEKTLVLLEISPALHHPVSFQRQEFIRVGSYTKNLREYPEKERTLWRIFDRTSFEKTVTNENVKLF